MTIESTEDIAEIDCDVMTTSGGSNSEPRAHYGRNSKYKFTHSLCPATLLNGLEILHPKTTEALKKLFDNWGSPSSRADDLTALCEPWRRAAHFET